jgi:hypothetical protein
MPLKKSTRLTGQFETSPPYRKYKETVHILCSDNPISTLWSYFLFCSS